jgi:hypothetical protein
MTRLQLSLGEQFVWALVQPMTKGFIKETDEFGFQETQLILSQAQPGPVEIVYEDLPQWAQIQVVHAIRSGQLTNAGDKIESKAEGKVEVKEEPKASEKSVEAAPETTRATTKKKASSRKSKASKE